jgi:hypothetical protein
MDASAANSGPPPLPESDATATSELSARLSELEGEVEKLRKERDSATAALASMKESARALRQEFEDSKTESEEVVSQWTGRCISFWLPLVSSTELLLYLMFSFFTIYSEEQRVGGCYC